MHTILEPEEDMQEERPDRRDAEIREAKKASSFFRCLTRAPSGPIVAEKVAAIEAGKATSSQKLVRPKSHGTASTDTLQEECATATEPVGEALPEPGTFIAAAAAAAAEAKLTSCPGSSSVDIAGNSSEAHRPYAPLSPPQGHVGEYYSSATDWAALMSSVDEVCPVNAAASEASADEPDEDCFLWGHRTLTQCGQHKRSGLYIIYDIICYIFQ